MQDHIYLLSLLIISFYILTTLFLCYMFSKGHVMLTYHFFSVTSQCMLINPQKYFCKKNHFNYSFKKTHHFKDELTRSIINTSLFTTLKNVVIFKIIEFYWFMHSAFCGWICFEKFHYAFYGRWFCWCMIFKHGGENRMLQTVSIYFLLFYHHCTMLKTDTTLDCW